MAATTAEMLAQMRQIAQSLPDNEDERKQIAEAAMALARAAESLHDQTQRLVYSNSVLPVARVAVELKLLEYLSSPIGKAHTIEELAEVTKAEPLLLIRILRFLSAYNIIDEPSAGRWAGSAWTKELAKEGNLNGINHQFETVGPSYNALPSFLRKTGFRNIDDNSNTPFHQGHGTDKIAFEWFGSHPENLGYFMKWLQKHRGGSQWTDTDLVHDLVSRSTDDATIVFVDVGGNVGNVCVDLRKRAPSLKGRVINQDLPHVVANTIEYPGVEKCPHDFWTPQTVKGARVYYLRNILHDWPDAKCLNILRNIVSAMDSDSEIWIDEVVIPDQGATQYQVNLDLTMMAGLAGMERSLSQWTQLLDEAGLSIRRVHTDVSAGSAAEAAVIIAGVK